MTFEQIQTKLKQLPKLSQPFLLLSAVYLTSANVSYAAFNDNLETNGALNLSSLIVRAEENNPEILAANLKWLSARERGTQVAALPDPRLNYGYFIEPIQTKAGPQQQRIGISQKLPWFGKLKQRQDIADYGASAVQSEVDKVRLKVIAEVKQQFYEYSYLAKETAITTEHLQLLNVIAELAISQFRYQTTKQQDLIAIQIEQSRLEERLRSLEAMRLPLSQLIYTLLGEYSDTPLPLPASLKAGVLQYSDEQLKEMVLESNPELIRQVRLLSQAETDIKQKQLDYYPDVTFGVNYFDINGGDDPLSIGVSINLPIWRDKLKSAEHAAKYRYSAIEKIMANQQNRLVSKLEMTIYRYKDATSKIKLYEDVLLPKSKQIVDLSQQQYQTGKSKLINLINAQRSLLGMELELARKIADGQINLAQIAALAVFNTNSF